LGKLAELSNQELLEKFKTCEDEYYVFKTAGDKTMMQKMVWKIIAVKKEMTKRGLDDPALGKTKYYHSAKELGLSIYGKPKALNVIQFWSDTEHSFKAATYVHGKTVVITWLTATEWLSCSKDAITLLTGSGVISEPYPEYLVLADVAHVKNLDAVEKASRFGKKAIKFKVKNDEGSVPEVEYWDGNDWQKMPSMVEPPSS